MKVLLFSCLLGGACAFGANPELASEGAVAQGFGTPGAPSEGDGRETRLVKGGGCPDCGPPKFDPLFPSECCRLVDSAENFAAGYDACFTDCMQFGGYAQLPPPVRHGRCTQSCTQKFPPVEQAGPPPPPPPPHSAPWWYFIDIP